MACGDRVRQVSNLSSIQACLFKLNADDSFLGQEQDQLVQQVMRLMLFKQQKAPDVPVRQSELAAVVNAAYKEQRKHKLSSLIILQAQLKFMQLLGIEMPSFKLKTGRSAASQSGGKAVHAA